MFDSHCHLNFDVFEDILVDVVNNARNKGVRKFLVPGIDIESSKRSIEISKLFEGVFAAVGIHPTNDLEDISQKSTLNHLQQLSLEKKVVAIGEVGLDYYKGKSSKKIQKDFLKNQITLAAKTGLSVVIHNRHASKDLVDLVSDVWTNSLSGNMVFHCCEPNKDVLQLARKKQIYLGFNGDLTYNKTKKDFIKNIPLDRIVVETDSPFLMPLPLKNIKAFPNEPKNLKLIVDEIAHLKDEKASKVAEITAKNAEALFNINL